MGTCVNLDIIRKRIREIHDGAVSRASILADSTANRSSGSENESRRLPTSSSGEAVRTDKYMGF